MKSALLFFWEEVDSQLKWVRQKMKMEISMANVTLFYAILILCAWEKWPKRFGVNYRIYKIWDSGPRNSLFETTRDNYHEEVYIFEIITIFDASTLAASALEKCGFHIVCVYGDYLFQIV